MSASKFGLAEARALLEKTIQTSSVDATSLLNPTQLSAYVAFVKRYAVTLRMLRFVRMTHDRFNIDKLHLNEPITVSADENVGPQQYATVRMNQVVLTAQKLRSDWPITTEMIQRNIEQDRFEDTVVKLMSQRFATDSELLAWRGDTTIVANPEDKESLLLRRLDGFVRQARNAHVVDARGAFISYDMFHAARQQMPKRWRNDANLRWFMPDMLVADWNLAFSGRPTPGGDQAHGGAVINPMGVPIQTVPAMADEKSIVVAAASPAAVKCTQFGPFPFAAGANTLTVNINGTGNVTVTFANRTTDASDAVAQINAVFAANSKAAFAMDDGEGRIQIITTTTGAGGAARINIAAASTALSILGVPAAAIGANVDGAAAGATSTFNEGADIILTSPMNLIWGMLDAVRFFGSFNQFYDRADFTMFNHVDAQIENLDAVVLVKNVRVRSRTTQFAA